MDHKSATALLLRTFRHLLRIEGSALGVKQAWQLVSTSTDKLLLVLASVRPDEGLLRLS